LLRAYNKNTRAYNNSHIGFFTFKTNFNRFSGSITLPTWDIMVVSSIHLGVIWYRELTAYNHKPLNGSLPLAYTMYIEPN
jgi:hypothetical protein